MAEELPRAIGQYEVTGRIGKGGMGQVFKAVQPSLNRVVAVKVLPAEFSSDPDRVERFNREAQAVALLNHPNVVQIIDKDRDGDLLYFVMEYVPGSSLDVVLKQRRLSLPEVLKIFKGVCRGLEAAHRKNITHRDLNPRNILVSEDLSTVKLADFGISRVDAISLVEGTLSTSALSLGSLHYMAPEQARDMALVDQRSDIYSLGVVLYEMLTGRLPVGRFSLPSQLNSEVPPELDPIVLKCLASSPEDRYPSMARLMADLARLEDQLRLGLVDELRGLSRSTTRIFTRSTRSVARSRGVQLGLAGALVLALALAGGYFLLRGRAAEPPVPPSGEIAPPPAETAEGTAGEGLPGELGAAAEPGAAAEEGAAPEPAEPAPPVPTAKPPAAKPAAAKPPAAKPAAPQPPPPSQPAASSADAFARDLKVARDQAEAKLYEPALKSLKELIDANPKSPSLIDAFLVTAEVQAAAGRPKEAMATLVETRSRFGKDPRSAEAGYRLGRLLLATGDKERQNQARDVFTETAAAFPDSPWALRSLTAEGEFELAENMYKWDDELATSVPAALVTLRQLTRSFPDAPEAEKALWNLAQLYDKIKRYEEAAAAYAELATRFPTTRYDAWWEAGQLYDRRLDQNAKAVDAYQRVPASSPHAEDAKKRISKLKR